MKTACAILFSLLSIVLSRIVSGHFTAKGHVHTHSETKQEFLNPDCKSTATCDLKRFTLTKSVNEIWFSDNPTHPTYANGVVMEYETDSVAALERYAIVQFMKGCIFYSTKAANGEIVRTANDTVISFGESVPYCFRNWVIDSTDSDPAYNSDPDYGRIYLARWNEPGSYDNRTQRYYGKEKPTVPIVYMTDHPSGAFVSASGVKNAALQFKTCIFKAGDVPALTRRDNLHFAKPIHCFDWQNVYIYDFATASFTTDLAAAPKWDEPTAPIAVPRSLVLLLIVLGVALAVFLDMRNARRQS